MKPGQPAGLTFHIDDPESPYLIGGTWEVGGRGMVLTELCVQSRQYASGGNLDDLVSPRRIAPARIASSALRGLSVAEIERRTREALRKQSEAEADTEEAASVLPELASLYLFPRAARAIERRLGQTPLRPGPAGYPIGLYRWVAREYVALVRARTGRRVLPELAAKASKHLGRKVTTENARDWVHRARELGLLTPGIRGKAHADFGPALRAEAKS